MFDVKQDCVWVSVSCTIWLCVQVLGEHPDDNEPVCVKVGSYGPYVSHGKLNARLPEVSCAEIIRPDPRELLLAQHGFQVRSHQIRNLRMDPL